VNVPAINISLSQYTNKTYFEFLNLHIIKPQLQLLLDCSLKQYLNLKDQEHYYNKTKLVVTADDLLLLPNDSSYKSLIVKKRSSTEEIIQFEYYINYPTVEEGGNNLEEDREHNQEDNNETKSKKFYSKIIQNFKENVKERMSFFSTHNNVMYNLNKGGNNNIVSMKDHELGSHSKFNLTLKNLFFIPVNKSIKEIPFFFEKNLEIFEYLKNKQQKVFGVLEEKEILNIQVFNSTVLFPESSKSSNMIIINSESLSVKISDSKKVPNLEIKQENPDSKAYLIDKKFLFNIDSIVADSNAFCPCIKVSINCKNVSGNFLVDSVLSNVIGLSEINLEIITYSMNHPTMKLFLEKWSRQYKGEVVVPKPELKIELQDGELNTNTGKLMAIKFFVDNNIEEKSVLFTESNTSLQNVELNIKVSKAEASIKVFKTPVGFYDNLEEIKTILPGGGADIEINNLDKMN